MIYTKKLNAGYKIKLIGESWNIYSSKTKANEAKASNAIGTIKKGQTFEILEIDSNVVKIGEKQYIYYGKLASQNFEIIEIDIKSISINEKLVIIKEGEQFKLNATVNSSIMNYQDVKWKSNNKNIAQVDTNGLVTAKKEGEAIITVTPYSGKVSAKCTIKVVPETKLEFKNDVETMKCENELALNKILTMKNINMEDIILSSSNEKVATIQGGIIKTKKEGTTVITAKFEDIETSCKIIVISENVIVKKLNVTPKNKTINTGKKITLMPIIKVDPDKTINKKLKYESSDESIATVSSTGVVKAIKPGNVTITVTSLADTSKTTKCNITVKQLVTGVNLLSSKTLKVGEKFTLKAGVLPANASNKELTWTSSNENIATVTKNGIVKAKKAGKVKIKAMAKDGSNKYGICELTVESVPTFQGVKLKYSEKYNVCRNPLTKKMGVKYYNNHKETFYSQKVLPGKGLYSLNANGRHVAKDGTIRDKDGYIAVACNFLPQGAKVMTSLGPAKVYDTGEIEYNVVDIYVNW